MQRRTAQSAAVREGEDEDGSPTTYPLEEMPEDLEPGYLFQVINKKDPHEARRRFGKLYWKAWHRLVLSFFLFMFGTTFIIIGSLCMKYCDEFDRGIAFFIVGLIMFMPGTYGAVILYNYLKCRKGYSYKMLPDMN